MANKTTIINNSYKSRAERLGILIPNNSDDNGGGNGNGSDKGYEYPKRKVKYPTEETVIKFELENPTWLKKEIVELFRCLHTERLYYPPRFKSLYIADGNHYSLDWYEDYAEQFITGHRKVYRDVQRARRKIIGNIDYIQKINTIDRRTGLHGVMVNVTKNDEELDKEEWKRLLKETGDQWQDEMVKKIWGRYNWVPEELADKQKKYLNL